MIPMFPADPLPLLAALGFGYLLGSIPFGLVLTRLAGKGDVREIGSGNIGATNVLRTGSRTLAAATLIGDALKGTLAVVIAGYLGGPSVALAAALGAFVGHVFPIWLRFRGGKGVATYIGALLGIEWPIALFFVAAWLVVAAIFRFSSLAALVASFATPLILYAYGAHAEAFLFGLMSLILWVNHYANIGRLIAGTEPRIGTRA
jgi:glycerol-3-phosphate acyltransferase PlsY